ncbi:Hypothetical predicted protein [Xyrichtys novacula]|uniref:Secreted protein n=1 Tax=Xyrichtys novacula TaxID=13765 RepID=A0AAV1GCG0_XYRNO|nr:Hypothetical predicted protein [Xyrichtys novacula]
MQLCLLTCAGLLAPDLPTQAPHCVCAAPMLSTTEKTEHEGRELSESLLHELQLMTGTGTCLVLSLLRKSERRKERKGEDDAAIVWPCNLIKRENINPSTDSSRVNDSSTPLLS